MTLSYDMTFVILLLSSLYEPKTEIKCHRCAAHPLAKRPARINPFVRYGADMNLLLSYYKCLDDWEDERKITKKAAALALRTKFQRAADVYPHKARVIQEKIAQIRCCERERIAGFDQASGCFGEIMAEILSFREDEWEDILRKMGFFLGKFIYLMDAYEDLEKDAKTGNYNVFLPERQKADFEARAEEILSMMMAECSRAFERLPIVENAEILRNILYSGVWRRYELVKCRREER